MDDTKHEGEEKAKEDVIVRPVPLSQLENVQTKSLVKSSHEIAEQELARVAEQNAAIARAARAEEMRKKARKIALYTFLGVLALALVVSLIWLIVNALLASRSPAGGGNGGTDPTNPGLSTIDGYACKTKQCNKVADLPDGRIILRDTSYYLYNRDSGELTLTSIDEQDYSLVTPFVWGKKTYAELDPETGPSALFSVSDNRLVTKYSYDAFYTKADDVIYKDMTDIVGTYIIARASDSYRIIDLASGNELARGLNGIYTRAGFFIGYESSSERRAYVLSGKQIITAPAGSSLYISGGVIVYVSADGSDCSAYDQSGAAVESGAIYDYLNNLDQETRVSTLNANQSYFRISTTR